MNRKRTKWLREKILEVIRSDSCMQNVYDEEGRRIDFTKLYIIPYECEEGLFAIVKESKKDREALVWRVCAVDGKERFLYVENEFLAREIIYRYLKRR